MGTLRHDLEMILVAFDEIALEEGKSIGEAMIPTTVVRAVLGQHPPTYEYQAFHNGEPVGVGPASFDQVVYEDRRGWEREGSEIVVKRRVVSDWEESSDGN